MGTFLIEPNKIQEYSRMYDNAFLWNEGNVYIMASQDLLCGVGFNAKMF